MALEQVGSKNTMSPPLSFRVRHTRHTRSMLESQHS